MEYHASLNKKSNSSVRIILEKILIINKKNFTFDLNLVITLKIINFLRWKM